MKKQLSRLEREYVLSRFSDFPVPVEIRKSCVKFREGESGVICHPDSYKYDRNRQRIVFSGDFISSRKIPENISFEFLFSHKEKRILFSSKISGEGNSPKFCPVGDLFYAEESAGKRGHPVEAKIRIGKETLTALSSPEFPLSTDKAGDRVSGFVKNIGRKKNLSGNSGLRLYMDHKGAVFAILEMSFSSWLYGIPVKIIKSGEEYDVDFSVRFENRKISVPGILSSITVPGQVRICKVKFVQLVPEDERFLYEMSRGEKYPGPGL